MTFHSPSKDNDSTTLNDMFVEEFAKVLNDIDDMNHEVLICGDFNINLLKTNSN